MSQPDTTYKLTQYQHIAVPGNNGQLVKVTRVSVMIGSLGPFTADFAFGQDTPTQIKSWIMQQQENVRQLGSY